MPSFLDKLLRRKRRGPEEAPKILPDDLEGAIGPGQKVSIWANGPGAVAVADTRHRPLPPSGPHAVVIPNGTEGVCRAVGDATYMIAFGADAGPVANQIYHLSKEDVWGGTAPDSYKRWGRGVRANDEVRKVIDFFGIPVHVEWPKGSIRRYPDSDYERAMFSDYGYIRDADGLDGEELDVYVGDDLEADNVYLIAQVAGEYEIEHDGLSEGEFDEWKVMLGFPSEAAATSAYLLHMSPEQLGPVYEVPFDVFRGLVLPVVGGTEKSAKMISLQPMAGHDTLDQVRLDEVLPGDRVRVERDIDLEAAGFVEAGEAGSVLAVRPESLIVELRVRSGTSVTTEEVVIDPDDVVLLRSIPIAGGRAGPVWASEGVEVEHTGGTRGRISCINRRDGRFAVRGNAWHAREVVLSPANTVAVAPATAAEVDRWYEHRRSDGAQGLGQEHRRQAAR